MDSDNLRRLKSELGRLQGEIVEAGKAIKQEEDHLAWVHHGVMVGTIVVDRHGKKYRVTTIETGWRDRPWVSGNPMKKDGTYGTAVRNLYNEWTLFKEDV